MAVEFSYTLYLSASIAALEAKENAGSAECAEIMTALTPFSEDGLLSTRGQGLLTWAREQSGDQPDEP
ncbi:MAG: hypothetical protein ACRDRV_06400 [Pseudonocardiaceae bacterium]